MKTRFGLLFAVLACTAGCASHPGARVQGDVKVFEHEQTAERLVQRGSAIADVGDTTRAQQYLEAALDNGAKEADVVPMLVSVCVRDGRYRLAVQYARRYLLREPQDARMHFVLGTLYAGLGESNGWGALSFGDPAEPTSPPPAKTAEARVTVPATVKPSAAEPQPCRFRRPARAQRHWSVWRQATPRS
jgi:tetratricopeptide (TPR) repeat protein